MFSTKTVQLFIHAFMYIIKYMTLVNIVFSYRTTISVMASSTVYSVLYIKLAPVDHVRSLPRGSSQHFKSRTTLSRPAILVALTYSDNHDVKYLFVP